MAETILNELIRWCKFQPRRGGDRQDYLTDLVKAVDVKAESLDEERDFFKQVSEPAVLWYNECISAMNDRYDLPEPPIAATNGIGEDDEDDDLEPDDDDEDEDDAVQHDPVKPGDEDVLQTHAEEAAAEAENEAKEAKAAAKPKRGKGRLPPGKKPLRGLNDTRKGDAARYMAMDGKKDRYGVLMGTKAHDAIMMYEKGATVREVTEAIGGIHRNILDTVATRGHKVEKLADGIMKVTHSTEF